MGKNVSLLSISAYKGIRNYSTQWNLKWFFKNILFMAETFIILIQFPLAFLMVQILMT